MSNKRQKKMKSSIKKAILFLLLLSLFSSFIFAYQNWKENKIKNRELEEKAKILRWSQEKHFCNFQEFLVNKEKKAIEKKKYLEELARIALEKRRKEAEKSLNKTLIISTSARGRSALGYFYAFGDGFMFKKGKIASGRKNYETPIGKFGVKFKKRENMSRIYPDESGRNNMNFMVAITNSGIALHQGSEYVPSHGCIHIPKKFAPWIFNWTDANTKIYVTNKSKIDYKHKTLDEIIREITIYNQKEKVKNSIKTEKIIKWPNGNIKERKTYLGGRLEGPQYSYYSNGAIKSKNNYYHNRKNGVQTEYYMNGVRKSFINLVGGKIWEKMTWYPTGEMNTYYKKPIPE